jgi:hypothetical protein
VVGAVTRAVSDGRSPSDLGSLGHEERILHVDDEMAHRVLDL